MLLFEIVFWFYLRVTVMQDIQKSVNDEFNFLTGKLGTDPDNKTSNFSHSVNASSESVVTVLTYNGGGEASCFTPTL